MADDIERDPAAELRAEIKAETYDEGAPPSPSYTFANPERAATISGLSAADAVDLAANYQGWRIAFSPGYMTDGSGFVADRERGRIQLYSQDGVFVAGGATYDELATAISRDGGPLSLDRPTSALVPDEEEEKRRAGRGGGDMGNPAHAALAANIRPEVGSGPGGLETFTTQKSAEYRADPEGVAASDYIRARLAEAERSANQPPLTLEAIAADPWNAVVLPLPAKADAPLLDAARAAVVQCAEILPALGEDQSRYKSAIYRLAAIDDQLEVLRPLAPLTLEAIAADPWNAVALPLPADADKELLTAARSAADYCVHGEHHLMMEARAGRNTEHWSEELHAAGIAQPDVHEYNEARWFEAVKRVDAIDEALERIDGIDPVIREANEASTKRQAAELAASMGQSLPGESAAPASDYISSRLAERREAQEAERGVDGQELAVINHGEGKTTGEGKTPGGGGRGMF